MARKRTVPSYEVSIWGTGGVGGESGIGTHKMRPPHHIIIARMMDHAHVDSFCGNIYTQAVRPSLTVLLCVPHSRSTNCICQVASATDDD
jgi:hypothetical protein